VTSFPDFYSVEGKPWSPPARAAGGASAELPFGRIDAPAEPVRRARGALELSGWALSANTLSAVEVSRADGELVLLGRARISNATRPDVAARYPELPQAYRSGWSFELRAADLPAELRSGVELQVHALDHAGGRALLGSRRVVFSDDVSAEPYLYCRKPFDNVYVDAGANVYPYPDCQSVDPFGSLASTQAFQSIWYGPAFEELRRRIVERDPPRMCLTCPDFINRNVDDTAYFLARAVEPALRRPLGYLDQPGSLCISAEPRLLLRGWALGYSPIVRIEILRGRETDEGGRVLVGTAQAATEDRPDVARAYPRLPGCERAGWSFELRAAELPRNGPLQITAVAWNADGLSHELGTTEVRFVVPKP
jgi:hypothetical protein